MKSRWRRIVQHFICSPRYRTLLNLQGQIQEAQAQRDTLSQQVAEQTQINAELAEDVANPDDPDRIADIARDKLGLVAPGEKVFIITN